MLRMIIKWFNKKCNEWFKKLITPKKKPITAEDFIYKVDGVQILYSIVQNNFNYCMHNGLLKRKDILEFKFMINKFVCHNEFKHETSWENDAHEIYRKLKSHSISKSHMLRLNEFLQPFITVEVPQPTEQTIKKYGCLVVVK